MVFPYRETLEKILPCLNYYKDNIFTLTTRDSDIIIPIIKKFIPCVVLSSYNYTTRIFYKICLRLLSDLKYSNKYATPELQLLFLQNLNISHEPFILINNDNIILIIKMQSYYKYTFIINLLDTEDDVIALQGDVISRIKNGSFNKSFMDISKLSDYKYNHYVVLKNKLRILNMFKNDLLYIVYYKILAELTDIRESNLTYYNNILPFVENSRETDDMMIFKEGSLGDILDHNWSESSITIDDTTFIKSVNSIRTDLHLD